MERREDHFDRRSCRELVETLLVTRDEEEDHSIYWECVWELRRRATPEVFEAARSLCLSACSLEQRIGCDILAQLGCTDRPFSSASFPLVAAVVAGTDDIDTLASGLSALGWLGDMRAVPILARFTSHANEDVRCNVAQALGSLSDDPRSIDALIRLSEDSSCDVRDWATFGMGSLTRQDSPALRDTLHDRLSDSDATVRGEALVGLAIRQDPRVVEPLCQALEEGCLDGDHDFAREALDELHDVERYPRLVKWKRSV